ncbi:MAG TPA: VOC family protein [Thermoanaerobaculia bacterium]|nr:VOC family protein [Thermoanaerobaculia bacterium]
MKIRRTLWILLFGLLACTLPGAAQELGTGRGIDHVGLLARLENFDAVSNIFSEKLGFSLTPALLSPIGAENRILWFRNLSYLEIDTVTDDNPFTQPFVDFLAHHEGAKFYGTEVLDASAAASFLTGAGYPNSGLIPAPPLTLVSTGQTVGATPLWQEIILTSKVAPDNSNFFVDYDEDQVQQMFTDFPVLAPKPHPNTAERIHALWLVVADLDAATDFYEGLGFRVGSRHHRIPYLGARATEVRLHHSRLLLLQPDGPGLAADFVADRGEGILGVSLKVRDLRTAHHLIQHNTGLSLDTFHFDGRNRFLVPASYTHGTLLEMVE